MFLPLLDVSNKYIIVNCAVALAVLSAFGLIRFFFNRYMLDLIEKFKQNNIGIRQIKEELNAQTRSSIIMNLFGYVMISLLLWILIDKSNKSIPVKGYEFFLISCLLLPCVVLCKRFLLAFIGRIFNINHFIRIYLFQMSLMRKILGLALAPIISVYFALNHMVKIKDIIFYFILLIFIFILLFTIYKILNTLFKNSAFRINLHFFLYLCAIEILPIVIIVQKIQS